MTQELRFRNEVNGEFRRLSDVPLPGVCATREVREAVIFKVCVLASGSSGNATFVATERTRVLIDAGLSFRELASRMASIGEDPAKLDAVLVSHEHSDHVSGLPVLARKLQRKIPVYMTHLSAPAIAWGEKAPPVETFQAGCRFTIGDIEVDSFTIPHDAIDPVAFAFRSQGIKIASVTDLGYIPESIKYHLRGTQLLLLESNHDLEMLRVGPYPWPVKQRVMGRKGHLSNDDMEAFVRQDLDASVTTLILAHLSENNNFPAQVRLVAEQALASRGISPKLAIAGPRQPTEIFIL